MLKEDTISISQRAQCYTRHYKNILMFLVFKKEMLKRQNILKEINLRLNSVKKEMSSITAMSGGGPPETGLSPEEKNVKLILKKIYNIF